MGVKSGLTTESAFGIIFIVQEVHRNADSSCRRAAAVFLCPEGGVGMAGHRRTLAIRGAQINNYIRFVEWLAEPDMIGRKDAVRVVCDQFGIPFIDVDNNNRLYTGAVVGLNMQEGRERARGRMSGLRGEGAGRMPEFDPDRIARRAARLEHERRYVADKVARQRSGCAVVQDDGGAAVCMTDDGGKDGQEVRLDGAQE